MKYKHLVLYQETLYEKVCSNLYMISVGSGTMLLSKSFQNSALVTLVATIHVSALPEELLATVLLMQILHSLSTFYFHD